MYDCGLSLTALDRSLPPKLTNSPGNQFLFSSKAIMCPFSTESGLNFLCDLILYFKIRNTAFSQIFRRLSRLRA